MTSFRQIEANRRNARKSTGPNTAEGKERSRRNAVRHGLTAETVIGALEDAEDYKAFEAAIIADYDAHSTVERELVLRLASLLWRLRRATTMETALFEIQADYAREFRGHAQANRQEIIYTSFGLVDPVDTNPNRASYDIASGEVAGPSTAPKSADVEGELARCFLRLAHLPSCPLDRLSRYEAILWRQAGQVLFALDALDRRKPKDRFPPFPYRWPPIFRPIEATTNKPPDSWLWLLLMGFPRSRQLFEADLVMASGPFLPIRDPSLGCARRGDRQRPSHRHGILAECPDGVERQLGAVFETNRRQFREHGGGRGDDVAPDFIGLEHVEDLAGRRPDDLDVGRLASSRDRVAHDRPIIDAGIDRRPANTDTQAGAPPASASAARCLLRSEDRRQVDLDAVTRRARTALNSGSPRVVVTGSFTYTFGPHVLITRACATISAIRRKTLRTKCDGLAPLRRVPAHTTIVEDSRRLHKRRIGGETPDPRLPGHFKDLRLVGAVGEQLDVEVFQREGHIGNRGKV